MIMITFNATLEEALQLKRTCENKIDALTRASKVIASKINTVRSELDSINYVVEMRTFEKDILNIADLSTISKHMGTDGIPSSRFKLTLSQKGIGLYDLHIEPVRGMSFVLTVDENGRIFYIVGDSRLLPLAGKRVDLGSLPEMSIKNGNTVVAYF
jgi:hypothetical protein